jgi:4-hydroxy-tetrahydrodipicolinate reductase
MTGTHTYQRANIIVHGANGRMGSAVIRCILQSPNAHLACALVRPNSDLADEPLTRVYGARAPDEDFVSSLDPDIVADVLVDFSSPTAFDSALAMALERRLAFVSGTSGLSDAQRAAMTQAAQTIPVLWTANFSLGIAMLERAVRRVATALPDWDCEIVEMHHGHKQDAPSGTAITLGHAVAEGRGFALADRAAYARHGQTNPRNVGEIGFASLRGGDVVGEHTVIFVTDGERIEMTHRATSRDIFARGALAAAIWIARREPGQHTFDQVLAPAE